nr:proline-rich protein 2-like [Manis javanica]
MNPRAALGLSSVASPRSQLYRLSPAVSPQPPFALSHSGQPRSAPSLAPVPAAGAAAHPQSLPLCPGSSALSVVSPHRLPCGPQTCPRLPSHDESLGTAGLLYSIPSCPSSVVAPRPFSETWSSIWSGLTPWGTKKHKKQTPQFSQVYAGKSFWGPCGPFPPHRRDSNSPTPAASQRRRSRWPAARVTSPQRGSGPRPARARLPARPHCITVESRRRARRPLARLPPLQPPRPAPAPSSPAPAPADGAFGAELIARTHSLWFLVSGPKPWEDPAPVSQFRGHSHHIDSAPTSSPDPLDAPPD